MNTLRPDEKLARSRLLPSVTCNDIGKFSRADKHSRSLVAPTRNDGARADPPTRRLRNPLARVALLWTKQLRSLCAYAGGVARCAAFLSIAMQPQATEVPGTPFADGSCHATKAQPPAVRNRAGRRGDHPTVRGASSSRTPAKRRADFGSCQRWPSRRLGGASGTQPASGGCPPRGGLALAIPLRGQSPCGQLFAELTRSRDRALIGLA